MDAKEAVIKAKEYFREIFSEEPVTDVALEELDFDGSDWNITIGFTRTWDKNNMMFLQKRKPREYRVISIDETGAVGSVKIREFSEKVNSD